MLLAPLPPAPASGTSLPAAQVAKAWAAARKFEAMALGSLLKPMFSTVDTAHGLFGGGAGEAMWQPMLVEAVAKRMAAAGGLGLAQPIFQEMLRAQEQQPPTRTSR